MNAAQTPVEFLQWWRPSGVLTLSAIVPDGAIETKSWPEAPSSWGEVEEWIETRNGTKNLYFIANESRPIDSKPSKADITDIHCAFTDCDPDTAADYKTGRAKVLEAAWELEHGDLPPSVIIDSGHGLNALWRLDEALTDVEAFEAVNKPFSEITGGLGVYNADRLLRLPGTINLATAPKRKKGYPSTPTRSRILFQSDATYSLDEIAAFVAKRHSNGHAKAGTDVPYSRMIFYSDVMARWHGDTSGLHDTSRSGMDMSLGALLKSRGFTFEEMRAILLKFPHGKGAENNERQFRRIWERSGADAPRDEPERPKAREIKVVDFATLMTEDVVEEPDYIEPDFAGPGGFVLVAGPPKAQKSFLLQEMLVAAATGSPFLAEQFRVPRPLRVFYLQAEMNRKLLRKRARAMREITPAKQDLLRRNLMVSERFFMILNTDGVKMAIETIKGAFPDAPPDIIAIDPMANVFDQENESDNAQVMRFLTGRIEAVRQAINPMACIVMAHHSTKKSTEDLARDPFSAIRGASALRGYYDSAIVIFRKDEESKLRKVHFELRSGEAPEPMTVSLVDGRFRKSDEMDAITPEVARAMIASIRRHWDSGRPLNSHHHSRSEGRYAPQELAKQFSVSQDVVKAILPQWFSAGIIAIEVRDMKKKLKGIKVIGEL